MTKVGEGEKSGRASAENRGDDLVDVEGCVELVGDGGDVGMDRKGLVGGQAEALV